ncbi:putative pentatricopeptide repeat-containing protein [Cinnamomum micranthum f. kanehirae]|uniref:Putative pentatricopeptide repeat-containing protein n=1 Tax=Cinnamomum micranthum f. kanehirae TaxID=337451 RepID=A0A3S4PH48_9MAGN|nr:putative pentatricopeptide repeat-containing protein [Cinnamomum micranthum f. kanehirae]
MLHLDFRIHSFLSFTFKSSYILFCYNAKTPLNSVNGFHFASPSSSLQTFSSLSSNPTPREYTSAFASALIYSSNTKTPFLGIQIHAQLIKFGLSNDRFYQNNLISMYSKCGDLSSAFEVFDEMPDRNLVSWTSMISGSIQNDEFEMGLELFLEMMRSGLCPNEFAFGSVLKACASMEASELGSSFHCAALKVGIEANEFVGSSLVDMYAKCGDVEMAELVFEQMNNRDIACWNAMIGGYALNECSRKAMDLLSFMHQNRLIADQFTFASALKGCSSSDGLKFGQQIHGLVIQNELELSSSVMNSLVNMYFKADRKDCAVMVFNRMKQRDLISWNTVITGYAQSANVGEVVGLFSNMFSTGLRPNRVTFSILFRLCGITGDLRLGLQFYCLAYHLGFYNNALIRNSTIEMFSRCGAIEVACCIFENLPTRDISAWNEMILGYNLNGCSIEALQLFRDLHELGIEPNEITYSNILGSCCRTEHQEIGRQIHASIIKSGFSYNHFVCCSLINAYARFGTINDPFKIFLGIKLLDLASWGAMISACLQQGCNHEALVLLNSLREAGEKPDEFVFGSTLNACANISALNQSKSIHLHVIITGFESHLCVTSAVVDAYAKCGDIDSSRMAFEQLSRESDAILFNTMITAYAQHGLVEKAVELFERMKEVNIQPNHVTFVSVISACSHLGLVSQGRKFFDSINLDHGLIPSAENFACLVDLLARNGFLEESIEIIENMPFEPWPAIWRSFLSGCRIHGNRELGELAAKHLLQLMPNNDAAYILLSRVYAEGGRWEDAAMVRKMMTESGIRKEPGYSWITI